jgi:hypothetical protein
MPNAWRVPGLKRSEHVSFRTRLLLGAGFIALQALALLAMDHPLICRCGHIELWHGNPSGPETSQHLTDWYTYTHVIHGFGIYLLLWLLAPRTSCGLRSRSDSKPPGRLSRIIDREVPVFDAVDGSSTGT